jgi:hypothetical protein
MKGGDIDARLAKMLVYPGTSGIPRKTQEVCTDYVSEQINYGNKKVSPAALARARSRAYTQQH